MVNVILQVLACLNFILVKFYIMLTIFWTQKVVINFYELWNKKEPHLKYFKVWGGLVKVNIPLNEKKILWLFILINFYGNMSNFLRWLKDILM